MTALSGSTSSRTINGLPIPGRSYLGTGMPFISEDPVYCPWAVALWWLLGRSSVLTKPSVALR